MAFGWLSGKKGGEKLLLKADRLAEQQRWAEALTYYEDALEAGAQEARQGARTCRVRLVESNLDEARAYAGADETEKAREHARLALDLASGEDDLEERARAALDALGRPPQPEPPSAPEPLFAHECSCASPCAPTEEDEGELDEADEVEESLLFDFYIESLSPPEQEALRGLGESFRKGFVLLQQGDTPAARPLLEAALDDTPTEVGPHYAMGLLCCVEKDLESAQSHFVRALEVDPDFAPALHHRADVIREAGHPAQAVQLIEAWIEENGEDGEGWALLSSCRLDAGHPEGALTASEQAERWLPAEDPHPGLLKAKALSALGRHDEALTSLQGVAARRPDLLEALIPLGQLLIRRGGASAERAAEVFKHCYRLDPERGWWHLLRVAEAYAARGWKTEARDVLETARRELPSAQEARDEWAAVSRKASG